jgi:soluble lytic murein transglycosylase-like protein
MNIDYRKVFLALIAAVIIAIPTASAFQNHNKQIESERQNNSRLQIDIEKKSTELEKLKIQTKESDAEKQRLKQENEQLQKDLQAKRAKQAEDAKIAAAQVTRPAAVAVGGGCESYRPLVQKYFGAATPAAMIVMTKESGCNPNAVSPTNDHGLFQLNNQPVYDPEANIQIAYAKFVSPRRGTNPNWSAWYAVCTPNLVPKYDGIWCS